MQQHYSVQREDISVPWSNLVVECKLASPFHYTPDFKDNLKKR
jgi:hypothetical protein